MVKHGTYFGKILRKYGKILMQRSLMRTFGCFKNGEHLDSIAVPILRK